MYSHFSSLTGLLEGVKGCMKPEQLERYFVLVCLFNADGLVCAPRFCSWVGKNHSVASGAWEGKQA